MGLGWVHGYRGCLHGPCLHHAVIGDRKRGEVVVSPGWLRSFRPLSTVASVSRPAVNPSNGWRNPRGVFEWSGFPPWGGEWGGLFVAFSHALLLLIVSSAACLVGCHYWPVPFGSWTPWRWTFPSATNNLNPISPGFSNSHNPLSNVGPMEAGLG